MLRSRFHRVSDAAHRTDIGFKREGRLPKCLLLRMQRTAVNIKECDSRAFVDQHTSKAAPQPSGRACYGDDSVANIIFFHRFLSIY